MATNKPCIEIPNRFKSLNNSDDPAIAHIVAGADDVYDDSQGRKQNMVNADVARHETEINDPTNGLQKRVDDIEAMSQIGDTPVETDAGNIISNTSLSGKVPSASAVNGVYNALDAQTGYYTCDTAGGEAAKTVAAPGFVLSNGGSVKIKMTNANSVSNATLNINSTGAKALYYDGERAGSSNTWEDGETIEVYYDGTSYYANNVAGGSSDGVFDLTAKTGDTYATLSDALTAANTAIPANKKKGGMSMKYVHTSDNKYVRFNYLLEDVTTAAFTNTANWQGVDDEPIDASENIVKSGGVKHVLNSVNSKLSNEGIVIPLEVGGISGSDGSKTVVSTRARCKIFIDNTKPVNIKISGSLFLLNYNTYNSEDYSSFVSQTSAENYQWKGGVFSTGKYLDFVFKRSDNGDITASDLETLVTVITSGNVEEKIKSSHDEIGTKVGDIPLGEVAIGGLDTTTGNINYSATSRIFSSFIDGRNNDITVSCTDNILIYTAIKYSAIGGTPVGNSTINQASYTFTKSVYGCYLRFVFKRSDGSDCTLADLAKITIKSSGQNARIYTLETDVKNIQMGDTPYARPWFAIQEHNGRLFGTNIRVQGNSGYTHKVIPVNGGETMQLTANSSSSAYCAIVKTYTEPSTTEDTPYDLATGETERRTISTNGTLKITIPSDARFLIVASLMNTDPSAAPTELLIDGYDVINGVRKEIDIIKSNVHTIQENDTPYYRPWKVIPEHNGILLGNVMQVQGFSGNTHKVVPVNGGEVLQIKANSSYIARCAIVKTYTEPAATGTTPYDFATGETERRNIAIGTTSAKITVPSDARFIIVSSLMGSSSANAEPASLLIDGYDVINGVRKEIGLLKNDIANVEEKITVNTNLEQGGVNDSTGALSTATSRVRTALIDGAFFIQVNDGYLINQIYKWTKAGVFVGAVEEDVPIGKSYEMEDSNYMYRVVMRNSTNTDFLPTESILSMLSTGKDYEYNRNIYGYLRAALNNEVEGKIVPFVRGTEQDVMTYDTSKEYERLVIGFMTDNHIDLDDKQASYNNVKDAVDFYNGLHIPVAAILEGGDAITKIVTTSDSKAKQMEHLERFFNMTWNAKMPCLYTKGNHDINTINVPPAYMLDDDDWGTVWFNRAETDYGIVRQTKASGKKSGYYYYDLDAWKVRIICVDCYDLDYTKVDGNGKILYSGGAATWVADEQYNWIANTALDFDDKDEKDWGVIMFMHYYRTYDEYGTDIEPKFANPARKINEMLVAFNSQTDYSEIYSFPDNIFFNLNVSANFSRYANLEKKPYFISLITGHRHFDGNEVLDGINNILTANQLCGENSADIRLKRVAHTKTQNLFDTFVIDLKARNIRAFRFGAGVTCYGNGGDRFLPDGLSF